MRDIKGGKYWYITSNATGTKLITEEAYDFGHSLENKRFEIGNYFTSKEDAVKVQIRIYNILKIKLL